METIILICLLVIIVLLIQDKIVIRKRTEQKSTQEKVNPNLPDIMGQPKPMRSLSLPNSTSESQRTDPEIENDNFDIEIDLKDFNIQIPQEELDKVFGKVPDFDDEEEEWNGYGNIGGDDSFGFAMGVTFEELSAVATLLQQERLEPSQQNKAIKIVQKIQGTELFSLLENSMENASQKIALLLDKSFSAENDSSSSIMRNQDFQEFDIGEFA